MEITIFSFGQCMIIEDVVGPFYFCVMLTRRNGCISLSDLTIHYSKYPYNKKCADDLLTKLLFVHILLLTSPKANTLLQFPCQLDELPTVSMQKNTPDIVQFNFMSAKIFVLHM